MDFPSKLKDIKLPRHIAIIMDGNGRWANARFMPRLYGHNEGMKSLKEILKRCGEIGISYLTVYAFSTENWKRSKEEVGGIFKLLITYVEKEIGNLMANDVKVNILGDITPLPDEVKIACKKAIKMTSDNKGIIFNIALNYGGRDEIINAIKSISNEMVLGNIKEKDITEELVDSRLYTGIFDIPDPDLIIRTSGEIRISNFLLWQSAYSEFIFVDKLWPEFNKDDLDDAIITYSKRKRRFGGR